MATAEECRTALEALAGRLSEVDPQKRAAVLADRTLSCTVTDLGVTFVTKLGADGASPVTEASPGDPPAQVRFSAPSDELLAISGDPKPFCSLLADRQGQGPRQPHRHTAPPQAAVTAAAASSSPPTPAAQAGVTG